MGAVAAFKDLPRAEHSPVPEACSVFSYKDDRVWRLVWSIKYKKSANGNGYSWLRFASSIEIIFSGYDRRCRGGATICGAADNSRADAP